MQGATIKARKDGPYLVTGIFKLLDSHGNEIAVTGDDIVLCRCGRSSNKPFCDGTHKRVGFTSTVEEASAEGA